MKHLNKHQCEKIKLKMMENILERNDMEGAGLLTYTATSHQGAIAIPGVNRMYIH